MIHVCSLAALPDTVKATGASHVLTVMANVGQVQRPESVLEANHLKVQMDDITEQMDGFVAPSDVHIEQVLSFVRSWDRNAPLVIHCYAGISRSTASAFAAACMLNPHRDEISIARQIRAASPIASAEPADRQPGRPGAGARGPDAARARRNGAGQHDWSKAGRSASISTDIRERRQMSEKPLTPIEIGLTAAIVAIEGNEPLILTASSGDRRASSPGFRSVRSMRSRIAPSRSACAPGWKNRPDCGSATSSSSIRSAIAAATRRPATPTRMSRRSATSR